MGWGGPKQRTVPQPLRETWTGPAGSPAGGGIRVVSLRADSQHAPDTDEHAGMMGPQSSRDAAVTVLHLLALACRADKTDLGGGASGMWTREVGWAGARGLTQRLRQGTVLSCLGGVGGQVRQSRGQRWLVCLETGPLSLPIGRGAGCVGAKASEDPASLPWGPSRAGAFRVSLSLQHSADHRACPLPAAIVNPKQPKEMPKSFSFDYSYWSHTSVSPGLGFQSGGLLPCGCQLSPARCAALSQRLDLSAPMGRGTTAPLQGRLGGGGTGVRPVGRGLLS